jgi:hypothetical protein
MPGGQAWREALEALAPEGERHLLTFEGHVTHLPDRDRGLPEHIELKSMVGDPARHRNGDGVLRLDGATARRHRAGSRRRRGPGRPARRAVPRAAPRRPRAHHRGSRNGLLVGQTRRAPLRPAGGGAARPGRRPHLLGLPRHHRHPPGRQEAASHPSMDLLVQQTPLGRTGRPEDVAAVAPSRCPPKPASSPESTSSSTAASAPPCADELAGSEPFQ